jgi:glycosyltransferase involved in cell wall biosynthesis
MQTDGKVLSVVVPMLNEEHTIGNVIQRLHIVLKQAGFRHEIIVVDDGSKDRSLEEAKKQGATVYKLKLHRGKGYALRAGFAKAKGDIIATIDSDGSHLPEELPLLLKPLLRREADMVIGTRFWRATTATSRRNQAGNHLFNALICILIRQNLSDSQSGFRVMTRQVLKSIKLKSDGYEIESEISIKTARGSFRIKEVPITFEQRTYGRSQIDPIADGLKIFMSIVSAYLSR